MFSVVIPTLNEEKYLGRLLESIKKQKLHPAEVIVADNHSKDRTREIAKRYGCKVVDGGIISEGRNNGAKAANQDIVIFLDADTELPSEDFFNEIIGTFIAKDADIASCFMTHIKEENNLPDPGHISINATKRLNKVTAKTLHNIIGEVGICVIAKKSFFEKIGGFDEDMVMMEDSEFFQRAVKMGGKYYVIPTYIGVSQRRFEKRKFSSSLKIASLLAVLTIGTLIGAKSLSNIQKKYEDEKGQLGGGDIPNDK